MEVLNSRTKILPVNKDLLWQALAIVLHWYLQGSNMDVQIKQDQNSRCLLFWGDHLDQCRLPKYYFTKSTFVA